MTEAQSATDERRARMTALAREEYTEAAEELADAEAAIGALRDRRKAALQILRLYDPEAKEVVDAEHERGRERELKLHQGKQHPGSSRISRENRERIADWLREHEGDPLLVDGFLTKTLITHPDWPTDFPGQAGTGTALPALADEGVIRLDRIGWVRRNGKEPQRKGRAGKVYKVVRHAAS